MKTLGKRLAYAIKASGVSQADLARAAGVTRSAVSQWVSGETISAGAEAIFALADATGFEPRWLATGKGPERTQGEQQLKMVCTTWEHLDARGRANVQRVAELESEYVIKSADNG